MRRIVVGIVTLSAVTLWATGALAQAPAPPRHIEVHHTPCNMADAEHWCMATWDGHKWVVTVRSKDEICQASPFLEGCGKCVDHGDGTEECLYNGQFTEYGVRKAPR